MLEIKHILFPIDFSDRCCQAVPFVEAVASRFGAKVTLISAASPYYATGFGDPSLAVMSDPTEILAELKARLDGALIKQLGHLRVERVAEIGDPASVIVEYAHANDVDLIMMPTHGYGPFRHLLLGSVTAKVLHDARVPVWTAAHVEGPAVREQSKPRNILCAVDLAHKSVELIRWAGELAKSTGASLRLMHAMPNIEVWPEGQVDRQFEEEVRQRVRNDLHEFQVQAGVDAPLCVTVGGIADSVRDEARRHSADLVVIGRGVLNEKLGRLRTHAYGIIRQSPCPVISV